jgi:hypothetical protein
MLVQAILFNKDKWNTDKARNWLKKHKYVPIKYVHRTEGFLRYRIKEPSEFKEFITKSYPEHGINIIMGILK